ncbi:MAG: hypothetical protein JO164_01540, partial [Candidatus Eremiobacteraeota bacterium]|nr:hypothetical protein [Candidatus Eremiobacteraeota bacterium]
MTGSVGVSAPAEPLSFKCASFALRKNYNTNVRSNQCTNSVEKYALVTWQRWSAPLLVYQIHDVGGNQPLPRQMVWSEKFQRKAGFQMDLVSSRASASEQRAILAHYERVAPLIAANFPHAPLVFSYYPHGLGTEPAFSSNHDELPHSVPPVTVTTSSGRHVYPGCAVNTILYYVRRGAVGVHSWTPAPSDPDAVGFARILLKPIAGATQAQLREALLIFRSALQGHA